jgi:SAM-dependent methyltransferase
MSAMPTYEEAMRERHRPAHAQRTAQTQAAFLLPHLRPGMDLLDLGCGPGTITAGLAEVVAPGKVVGVDLQPALPDGTTGVTLVTADVHHLPFPDASFDAIFASTLLQHVPDPLAVLREARRVARPGAVIGVVDADWDGQLRYPTNDLLERSRRVADRLREGTSPYVGRRVRGLLAEAGFSRCEGFARVGCEASAEAARAFGTQSAAGYAHPAMIERVVNAGIATADEMLAFAQAWREWGEHPGAYLARLWCEAIGWAD